MTELQKAMAEKLSLTEEDFKPKNVTRMDEIEAQVMYTALLTDTLIEGGDDDV